MGTWDWDLSTNAVQWSDNLAEIHGLPPNTFDGTFASYEREIHPDDRARVLAAVQRALSEGVPYDVEYRLVAPDGTIRWCEGKGRVEYQDGRPVRMSGICMMVTRRKQAELAKLAAAEEANRQKDEFLATLSHELRTPLNAILGWVQMLENGEVSGARARQAIEVIGRNARLQTQLIEDILDVSRIISGKLEIERVAVSVPSLLEAVIAGASPAAEARRISFESHVADGLPPIEGDPRRLHQVLNNVLVNALKFTPEGGSVALACRSAGDWVEIEVRDTGVGIPAAFLPYVFDRFRQADSRPTRAHSGLGLGLAIARHLVEQHGGRIRAHSDGPGTGTTITVRLPAGSSAVVDPRHWVTRAAEDVRLDQVTVLVVDDQRDSREMVATLLQHRGALVRLCDNAESALAILATQPVDVLIADIAMPDVDGNALMRRLRALGNTVPAIAVTAFARPDDREHAMASGYTEYLRQADRRGEAGRDGAGARASSRAATLKPFPQGSARPMPYALIGAHAMAARGYPPLRWVST